MESYVSINNHVFHRFFFFSPFSHWMEKYLHYKNATHKKPKFFNQPDQPPGIGLKPWSWATTWGGDCHRPSLEEWCNLKVWASLLSCTILLEFQC